MTIATAVEGIPLNIRPLSPRRSHHHPFQLIGNPIMMRTAIKVTVAWLTKLGCLAASWNPCLPHTPPLCTSHFRAIRGNSAFISFSIMHDVNGALKLIVPNFYRSNKRCFDVINSVLLSMNGWHFHKSCGLGFTICGERWLSVWEQWGWWN